MRRTTIVLVAVTAVSCAASVVLAVGWSTERNTLHSVQAELATVRRQLAFRPTSSPTAQATQPPTASAAASVSSSPICPAGSSASDTAATRPQIKSVADSLGRIWFPYDQSTIKVGTVLCFTVRAVSPSGSSLQYKLWTGERPNQSLVCDWSGPTCRWNAVLPQGVDYTPYTMKLSIAIRTNESAHRLSGGACFGDDACDDVTWIQFTLG